MTDTTEIKDVMKRMKDDLRALINQYAEEANSLASESSVDPHAPVVAAMQIALANAAVDYMLLCGATPPEALQNVTNVTGMAMKQWIDTIVRLHKLNAKTTTASTIIRPN